MPKVTRIERANPPEGGPEIPVKTSRGYQLADPKHGSVKHHAEHAVFASTLDEAADLIERRRFSIWLKQGGKRQTLISPGSLRIVREP